MSLPARLEVLLDRDCPACRSPVTELAHVLELDYSGGISLDEAIDRALARDITLVPTTCGKCGSSAWPTHVVQRDPGTGIVLGRGAIGSHTLPVVSDDASVPYAVMRSAEEQEEYERGAGRQQEAYESEKDAFWQAWTREALGSWTRWARELAAAEWAAGYEALNWPALPAFAAAAAWRGDFERRVPSDDQRALLWRAANSTLVGDAVWMAPDTLPVASWTARHGRERTRYVVLHLPLPEELEPRRSLAMASVVPERSDAESALWERIRHLGRIAESARRRAESLAAQLQSERAARAMIDQRLAAAKQEIEALRAERDRLAAATPDRELALRLVRYRSLVREMRAEIERLESLLPAPAQEPEAARPEERQEAEEAAPEEVALPSSVRVAVFGRPGPAPDGIVPVDADAPDAAVERAMREADAAVVLTRRTSHRMMWLVRDLAAELGIPVAFSRETGWRRAVAEVEARFEARECTEDPGP